MAIELNIPNSAQDIQRQILEDLRIGAFSRGITDLDVSFGSDAYIWSAALANTLLPLYANANITAGNISEITANAEQLDIIRQAMGLPQVEPAQASGSLRISVTTPTVSILEGTEFITLTGIRGRVVTNYIGVSSGAIIDVQMIEPGSDGNQEPGTQVSFLNPAFGLQSVAEVVLLTGGTDEETTERLRQRIINRRRNIPNAGNPGYIIDLLLNSTTALDRVYVYPALGGAGTVAVAISKAFNPQLNDYSREVSNVAVIDARSALDFNYPAAIETFVVSVVDEPVDITVGMSMPTGSASGFSNATVWPRLIPADNGRVTVTTVTSESNITVSAGFGVSPVDGITLIDYYNPATQVRTQSRVLAHSGSAGAWQLTLETPLPGVQTGDYIGPAVTRGVELHGLFLGGMAQLGCSEMIANPGREARVPGDLYPAELTPALLAPLFVSQVRNVQYLYRSKTEPTVPTDISGQPGVLTPRCFAIYAL